MDILMKHQDNHEHAQQQQPMENATIKQERI
jgi:hypothetical protein